MSWKACDPSFVWSKLRDLSWIGETECQADIFRSRQGIRRQLEKTFFVWNSEAEHSIQPVLYDGKSVLDYAKLLCLLWMLWSSCAIQYLPFLVLLWWCQLLKPFLWSDIPKHRNCVAYPPWQNFALSWWPSTKSTWQAEKLRTFWRTNHKHQVSRSARVFSAKISDFRAFWFLLEWFVFNGGSASPFPTDLQSARPEKQFGEAMRREPTLHFHASTLHSTWASSFVQESHGGLWVGTTCSILGWIQHVRASRL